MRIVTGFSFPKDASGRAFSQRLDMAMFELERKAELVQKEINWFTFTLERNPQATGVATYTLKADLK